MMAPSPPRGAAVRRRRFLPATRRSVPSIALAAASALSLYAASLWFLLPECQKSDSFLSRTGLSGPSPSSFRRRSDRDRGGGGNDDDNCTAEYKRVNQNRTVGLTAEDLERSRAWVGNRHRLSNVAQSLRTGRAINVVVCGGSISLGHGVTPVDLRYSDRLERWLNAFHPVAAEGGKGKGGRSFHRVFNRGAHGADMCSLAKRMNLMMTDLSSLDASEPSLFVLEFGVNDYQGQDFKMHIDHKTDVFFDGFEELALCAEVVVNKLLREYPNAAVMFLEFRTAILNRKTAQLLHLGVAQHYEVPMVSYAEAMFPDYLRLASMINSSEAYSVPTGTSVLPYPHGCAPCRAETITEGFRSKGCKSVCVFMMRSGERVDCREERLPPGTEHCHVPFLAHDAIHPSAVGHQIAADLIVHTISSAGRDLCEGRRYAEQVLPDMGWLGAPKTLRTRGNFLYVKDTMQLFSMSNELKPTVHTPGFTLYGDGMADRTGWISTNLAGGESIEFELSLPQYKCYAVYVAVLRSYEGMGQFTVTVTDHATKKETSTHADGLWKARISVWSDIQLTKDDDPGCTGECTVKIQTSPAVNGRSGNKVKILTLSARKCEA